MFISRSVYHSEVVVCSARSEFATVKLFFFCFFFFLAFFPQCRDRANRDLPGLGHPAVASSARAERGRVHVRVEAQTATRPYGADSGKDSHVDSTPVNLIHRQPLHVPCFDAWAMSCLAFFGVCFTYTETVRTIRDGSPGVSLAGAATSVIFVATNARS